MTILYFFDYLGEPKGEVTLSDDGTISASTEGIQAILDTYIVEKGYSPERFIAQFDGYNNGYMQATTNPV